jgi:formylglycine-generating enzyme required for sulfatase activity
MHLHRCLRRVPLALFFTFLGVAARGAPATTEAADLRWTTADNGQAVDWADAKAYCAGLGHGWRLPAIEELDKLYTAAAQAGDTVPCGDAACKAPPQFQLSSAWHWSGTAVTKEQAHDYDELAWGLTLVNGRRTMALNFSPYGARALCVHSR